MKKALKILIMVIVSIVIVYLGYYIWYNFLSVVRTYNDLDKTCEVDSDC